MDAFGERGVKPPVQVAVLTPAGIDDFLTVDGDRLGLLGGHVSDVIEEEPVSVAGCPGDEGR